LKNEYDNRLFFKLQSTIYLFFQDGTKRTVIGSKLQMKVAQFNLRNPTTEDLENEGH